MGVIEQKLWLGREGDRDGTGATSIDHTCLLLNISVTDTVADVPQTQVLLLWNTHTNITGENSPEQELKNILGSKHLLGGEEVVLRHRFSLLELFIISFKQKCSGDGPEDRTS